MQFKEIIRLLRKEKRKTQATFAQLLGVSVRSISSWERGEKSPLDTSLDDIATACGYPTWEAVEQRFSGEVAFSYRGDSDYGIPVFAEVPAGSGDFDPATLGEDNGQGELSVPLAIFPDIHDPMAFAVRVKGDSMMPTFADGEIVVCSPARPHETGMYGVFRLDDGDCGLKVIEQGREPGHVRLVPLNDRYPVREVAQDSIVRLARVVAKTTHL